MKKNYLLQLTALVLFSLSLAIPQASAQTLDSLKEKMSGYLNKIESRYFTGPAACGPTGPTPLHLTGSPACVSHYQNLFSKPDVNVTMAFGYSDNRPNPSLFSGVAAHSFMQTLTNLCPTDGSSTTTLCGFTKDAKDPTLFSKSVIGPDGKMHAFNIHVVSAIDPDKSGQTEDDLNKSPQQKTRSAQATQAFEQALQKDDVVVYDGPSRDCAGPDFNPPALLGDKSVDSSHYKNHASLTDMIKSLSTSAHHPAALALIASDSKSCFQKQLSAAAPGTALLTSNVGFSTDPVDVLYSKTQENAERNFIEGIMNLRCDDNFVPSLQDGDNKIFDLNGWGVKTPNADAT